MVRTFHSESDWLHCPKCGADTLDIAEPNGFDPQTGRERVKHYRKCPNGRFWNSAQPGLWDTGGQHLAKTEMHYVGPRTTPSFVPVIADTPEG